MKKDELIIKCTELIKLSEKEFLNTTDIKAKKYNKIATELIKLEFIIIERSDYKDIFQEILKQTNEEKYWKMHYDMAELLYFKDKKLMLDIYKIHKGRAIADARIKELEKELKQEKKGKNIFSKFFGK